MTTLPYSVSLAKLMKLANTDSLQTQGTLVRTEHVLLALIKLNKDEKEGLAASILKKIGVDLDLLLNDVERHFVSIKRTKTSGEGVNPNSKNLQDIFANAERLARVMDSDTLGTQHVLFALCDSKSDVAPMLRRFGVTAEIVLAGCMMDILRPFMDAVSSANFRA